jgi:NADH:ubiquinone oxidoreductase subunit F (NADH-binding)/(2Fe-2S) ferredoxin
MLRNFNDTRSYARARWDAFANGEIPWIRVGTALCGQAAGSQDVLTALRARIHREAIWCNVSEVGCLGLCFAEPLVDVMIPGGPRVIYGNVTPESVEDIIDSHVVNKTPLPDMALGYLDQPDNSQNLLTSHPMMKNQLRIALRNSGNIDPFDIFQYIFHEGYEALYKAVTEMTPEQVLDEVRSSGLRGRGGAGFPTGTKWSFLSGSPGPVKYILCNCEEGDPGAFNDKAILESDPHTLIEGMALAGYATGATYGYVFIRQGHRGPIERSRRAIEQAREQGLLGTNIFGTDFSFDIEVSLTGDSYIAGEETALMESIEGKRAMPRYRPPFPAQVGLFGKPTNINNVKTLSYVPEIVLKGGEWFANIGPEKSNGTAILCLSGNLAYTGMVEVPLGMTLRDVIENVGGGVPGGKSLKLLQTGGPLGGVLGIDGLDVPLDFEAMAQAGAILGSGGIIAVNEDTCAVDLTRALIAFCQYESCGKCFPCRLGMTHLLEILERACSLKARYGDLELMHTIGKSMKIGSLCGHGQLGFNPVSSALKYFGTEFDAHLNERRCPTGWCSSKHISPKRTRR